MVIYMDMTSGKKIEEPVAPYDEEVLNASWLPQPALQLGLQMAETARQEPALAPTDVEGFLAAVYRFQE